MADLYPVELSEKERKYIASHLTLPTYGKEADVQFAASILERLDIPVEIVAREERDYSGGGWDLKCK